MRPRQWLQLRFVLDSTAIRRVFDCLSKVIGHSDVKPLAAVTLTYLFIYLGRSAASGRDVARPVVVALSNCSRIEIESQL